ncbi:hypothetical protein [Celerinatantimonas diazotrophica]|uniref:Uncharacterized protein n=1 Tax=Celerinatantimonas diazotrophica TaxID=412034 RepID=A0A4R1J9X3_9GAMM|nr:hypothetical protein [Celerinatantimonas diazotrophica]TCK47412.1 hypothetical protein EV690_2436 [Celerinatantimonas diazotrophica]CAG9294970.1 hypothetical protein CEDIAZO_00076 [Celerinatantimonas diazotrophica]
MKEYQTQLAMQEIQVEHRVYLVHTQQITKSPQQLASKDSQPKTSREKFAFPTPKATESNECFCDTERVIAIYNKEQQKQSAKRKKMTVKIQQWFEHKALAAGWKIAKFVPHAHNNRIAGCMLSVPPTKGVIDATTH